MRPQTLLILVLALGFGGVAAAGVFLLSGREAAPGDGLTTVLVMTADVGRGETISAESIAAKPYPKDLLPPGALTKHKDALGRAALVPLVKDEPLMEAKLSPKGGGRGLAALIKKGMRAITLPTPNVATGVAGFIVPGSRVDVLWASQERGEDPGGAPLLEDVEILAVDEKIDAPAANRVDAGQMKSVTIQVKPEDAAKLAPALIKGTIYLSLRNPGDDSRAPARPRPAPAPAPPTPAVVKSAPPTVVAAPMPKKREKTEPAAAPRAIRTFRGTREGWVRLDTGEAPKAGKD